MTSEQHRRIRQALENHRRPPRTQGTKIREALAHIKRSEMNKPGAVDSSNRAGGIVGCESTDTA